MVSVLESLRFVDESTYDHLKRKYIFHNNTRLHEDKNDIFGAISIVYRDTENIRFTYTSYLYGQKVRIPMTLFKEEHSMDGSQHRYMVNDLVIKEYSDEN